MSSFLIQSLVALQYVCIENQNHNHFVAQYYGGSADVKEREARDLHLFHCCAVIRDICQNIERECYDLFYCELFLIN